MSKVMSHGSWVVGLLVTLTAASGAAAQDSTYHPHGFISMRYDSWTSSNIYVGYEVGPVRLMGALVSNPRTGYREHILGVVKSVDLDPHLSCTFAVAGAKAIDAWYAQYYILPSLTVGPVELNGTFEQYIPLEAEGVTQYGFNPANLFVSVDKHLRIGGVAVWAAATGVDHVFGAGPSAQIRIPQGYITVDGVLGVTRYESEWRVSFFTTY
jgi:hypothetical protein